ncbi:hypothetical protein BDD12DRAFT_284899 [Trichophaea hybrida]|nr:hypothetical protein BDD12DRAFT_284899 [Trichophaea hybrida]
MDWWWVGAEKRSGGREGGRESERASPTVSSSTEVKSCLQPTSPPLTLVLIQSSRESFEFLAPPAPPHSEVERTANHKPCLHKLTHCAVVLQTRLSYWIYSTAEARSLTCRLVIIIITTAPPYCCTLATVLSIVFCRPRSFFLPLSPPSSPPVLDSSPLPIVLRLRHRRPSAFIQVLCVKIPLNTILDELRYKTTGIRLNAGAIELGSRARFV